MELMGEGKQKRVVGAGDGRRKRAEVVKKVMSDQGLSMIEASKFVKEHGLYQP
jgi:ribosomal protein L7/L12